MIKRLLNLALVSSVVMVSCAKDAILPAVTPPVKATSEIQTPKGFTWENSRNISFIVSVADVRFQGKIHVVAVYDGDPAVSGKLLTKGSATALAPFRSKVYLSNLISSVYVVTSFPNGVKTTQKVAVAKADISLNAAI